MFMCGEGDQSERKNPCVFDGLVDADTYVGILENTLLPFLNDVYPEGHSFFQDNDPKHTSRHAQSFFEENNINWWRMPPDSPDLNPIENLWHEIKEFLRREVKPQTKEQLVSGIEDFWKTVTVEKWTKYIRHFVISVNGAATGY